MMLTAHWLGAYCRYRYRSWASRVHPNFKYVRRADGSLLTRGNLPPADTTHWVIGRKADVVMAVNGGLITLEGACSRYSLSSEEFLGWQIDFRRFGKRGLRVGGVGKLRRVKSVEGIVEESAFRSRSPQQISVG